MSDHTANCSRRRFMKLSAVGIASIPLGHVLLSSQARAQQDLPKLEEDNPQAQALNYVHDASQSEQAGENQFCYNCNFYQSEDGAEWGPCSIFPGKLVNANGWCSAWVKQAG